MTADRADISSTDRLRSRLPYDVALNEIGMAECLSGYEWRVVGTPPLRLDMPDSDIDIICEKSTPDLEARLWRRYVECQEFSMRCWVSDDRPLVCSFSKSGWTFEVFAADLPVERQTAWRHFAIEARVLGLGGETLRERVMFQRKQGLKTEPAFARVLRLPGNPYAALLTLEEKNDREIMDLVQAAYEQPKPLDSCRP